MLKGVGSHADPIQSAKLWHLGFGIRAMWDVETVWDRFWEPERRSR